MRLSGPVFEQLNAALCDAFTTPAALVRMARFRLDRNLGDFIDLQQPNKEIVFALVTTAEREGWTSDLIAAAHKFVPGNGLLRRFCEEQAPAALVATDPTYGVRTVEEGFRVLVRLMGNRTIHDSAVEFRTVFRAERDHVETLANYKELHDGLHDLQFRFVALIDGQAGKGGAGMSRVELENCESDLRDLDDRLRPIAARVQTARTESNWLRKLREATNLVQRGREERNPEPLWKARGKMEEFLATEPSRIYSLLTFAFKDLGLRKLVMALKRICDAADDSALPADNVLRYRAGLERLSGLERSLGELVAEHGDWQQIDNNLNVLRGPRAAGEREDRPAAANPSGDPHRDDPSAAEPEGDPWGEAESLLLRLCNRSGERWADELARSVTQFSGARGNGLCLADSLELVRYKAVKRFFNVDKQLNKLCDELKQIGERLDAVLEVLNSEPAQT